MARVISIARIRSRIAVSLLPAVVLLVMWVGAANALSLLQVKSSALSEGELLTLKFDQDLSLRLTVANGQSIQLETTSPFFNDAAVPTSQFVTGVDGAGKVLTLTCNVPVQASLRRAGAGTWLLMLRATGAPPQPVRTQQRATVPAQSETPPPPPVETEPVSAEIEDQLSDSDLLMLARLHKMQGRNTQAEETVNQIPEDSPEYPWGRLLMGDLKEVQGDESGAKQEYEKALKYPATKSAAATNLALWYQRRGEKKEAETMWETVLASGDAGVAPLAEGSGEGAGGGAMARGSGSQTRQQGGSGITLDGDGEPMEFFDTRILLIIVVALIATGVIAGGLLFHRARKKGKQPPPMDSSEDEVFWGNENDEIIGDGKGSLEAELNDDEPLLKKKPAKTREMKISEETRKMVIDLHNSGNSVREIAEITGKSQDEIRMAMQMEGVPAEP